MKEEWKRRIQLKEFIDESNRIEGITINPSEHLEYYQEFLAHEEIQLGHLQKFVAGIQYGAMLRDRPGMDVRVGSYHAPKGGEQIRWDAESLLEMVAIKPPHYVHCRYLTLHPFMDGNGRSARVLWLWMMLRQSERVLSRGFLHEFYYQTQEAEDGRSCFQT